MATVSVVLHHDGRGPLVHPRVDGPPIIFEPFVPVDVDEELAGEEPGEWIPFVDEDGVPVLVVPDDGRAYRWADPVEGKPDHLESRSLGRGLLAHVDDFRRADPPPAPPARRAPAQSPAGDTPSVETPEV